MRLEKRLELFSVSLPITLHQIPVLAAAPRTDLSGSPPPRTSTQPLDQLEIGGAAGHAAAESPGSTEDKTAGVFAQLGHIVHVATDQGTHAASRKNKSAGMGTH